MKPVLGVFAIILLLFGILASALSSPPGSTPTPGPTVTTPASTTTPMPTAPPQPTTTTTPGPTTTPPTTTPMPTTTPPPVPPKPITISPGGYCDPRPGQTVTCSPGYACSSFPGASHQYCVIDCSANNLPPGVSCTNKLPPGITCQQVGLACTNYAGKACALPGDCGPSSAFCSNNIPYTFWTECVGATATTKGTCQLVSYQPGNLYNPKGPNGACLNAPGSYCTITQVNGGYAGCGDIPPVPGSVYDVARCVTKQGICTTGNNNPCKPACESAASYFASIGQPVPEAIKPDAQILQNYACGQSSCVLATCEVTTSKLCPGKCGQVKGIAQCLPASVPPAPEPTGTDYAPFVGGLLVILLLAAGYYSES